MAWSDILSDAVFEGAAVQIEFETKTHAEAIELIKRYADRLEVPWRIVESEDGENWYTFDDFEADEPLSVTVNVFVDVEGDMERRKNKKGE